MELLKNFLYLRRELPKLENKKTYPEKSSYITKVSSPKLKKLLIF